MTPALTVLAHKLDCDNCDPPRSEVWPDPVHPDPSKRGTAERPRPIYVGLCPEGRRIGSEAMALFMARVRSGAARWPTWNSRCPR